MSDVTTGLQGVGHQSRPRKNAGRLVGARIAGDDIRRFDEVHLRMKVVMGEPGLSVQEIMYALVDHSIWPDDASVAVLAAALRAHRAKRLNEEIGGSAHRP